MLAVILRRPLRNQGGSCSIQMLKNDSSIFRSLPLGHSIPQPHYLHHGSFSYDGTTNDGRVDVVLLDSILRNAR